ncbi:MAG: 2TM domain-containing protein [Noviherbaspirillum sp.]
MKNVPAHRDPYADAKRHVERKIGFFIHLAVFVTVNSGLMLLNLLVVPGKVWAFWPLLGWGIGLLFHGLGVFLHAPGATWKQRMIANELKRRQQTPSA